MGTDKGGLHVSKPDGPEWYPITSQEDDFQTMTNSGFLSEQPCHCCCKKNVSPLTKLHNMLYEFSEEKRQS